MKNNLFGFSFVEVIVVVAIISIIWAMWIWNFLTFYKNQEFSSKISNLETFLKQEDLKVKSKEITRDKFQSKIERAIEKQKEKISQKTQEVTSEKKFPTQRAMKNW